MRSPGSQHVNPRSASTSSASLMPCPPFTRTATPKRSDSSPAAASISRFVAMPLPQSTSASGMLGVITLASGNKRPVSASEAPSLIRRLPLVDTITGSTTMFSAACARSDSAIATTFNADDTMPIFTAPGRMSSNTASICCTTNSLGTSSTPETPRVFWAVSAVIAVWANRPECPPHPRNRNRRYLRPKGF